MPRNIEIKARLRDVAAAKRIAERLSGGPPVLIEQDDTFFHVPRGRLKLRVFSPSRGELIYYERGDTEGPKSCEYSIAPTAEPAALETVLARALGERGRVRKHRLFYRVGRTRIHIDAVEGLGDFLELEVVMAEGEPAAEGEREARRLMAQLGVRDEDLIDRAYIDLLEESS